MRKNRVTVLVLLFAIATIVGFSYSRRGNTQTTAPTAAPNTFNQQQGISTPGTSGSGIYSYPNTYPMNLNNNQIPMNLGPTPTPGTSGAGTFNQ